MPKAGCALGSRTAYLPSALLTTTAYSLRNRCHAASTGGQIHGALFRSEDLEALVAAFQREGEMRDKEERRVALKRQQFEDSMVRTNTAVASRAGQKEKQTGQLEVGETDKKRPKLEKKSKQTLFACNQAKRAVEGFRSSHWSVSRQQTASPAFLSSTGHESRRPSCSVPTWPIFHPAVRTPRCITPKTLGTCRP